MKGKRTKEEIIELQFQRLLKNKRSSYIVWQQAQEMFNYARSKGIDLEVTQVNFLLMLEVPKNEVSIKGS